MAEHKVPTLTTSLIKVQLLQEMANKDRDELDKYKQHVEQLREACEKSVESTSEGAEKLQEESFDAQQQLGEIRRVRTRVKRKLQHQGRALSRVPMLVEAYRDLLKGNFSNTEDYSQSSTDQQPSSSSLNKEGQAVQLVEMKKNIFVAVQSLKIYSDSSDQDEEPQARFDPDELSLRLTCLQFELDRQPKTSWKERGRKEDEKNMLGKVRAEELLFDVLHGEHLMYISNMTYIADFLRSILEEHSTMTR